MIHRQGLLTLCFAVLLHQLGTVPVHAKELISDGGFEDDATDWDSDAVGDGDWWLADVGDFTPASFFPTSAEGGGEGTYVVSDQFAPTDTTLFQTFSVPAGVTSVILSYDMFVNDWSNQTSFTPSQHARVDLLAGDASPFDTGEGVVLNTYLGTDGGPLPNPFVHYEFDITPFVADGGEYQLRFLAVNSFESLNQGVDNVSVSALPEPPTLLLALLGCIVIGRFHRRPTY